MQSDALALPLSSNPAAESARRGTRRVPPTRHPVSDHSRFIQDVRSLFPGARVVDHIWSNTMTGGNEG